MDIKKAVIPAAGFGTRFLPATKAIPKEMLPVAGKPTIQYVVEEAVEAGISDILLIIGRGKRAIEEHFSRNWELENVLEKQGKREVLLSVKALSSLARIHYIWQEEQRGLGDAILCAKKHIGNEPFAVLLGDTIVESSNEIPAIGQLAAVYEIFDRPVVALEKVAQSDLSRYGIAAGKEVEPSTLFLHTLVEKPAPEDAPSNLAVASRYILTPDIFTLLADLPPGKNNEVQLTDALARVIAREGLYGYLIQGTRHDVGNKLDFIKANIAFGLRQDDIGTELRGWLESLF